MISCHSIRDTMFIYQRTDVRKTFNKKILRNKLTPSNLKNTKVVIDRTVSTYLFASCSGKRLSHVL